MWPTILYGDCYEIFKIWDPKKFSNAFYISCSASTRSNSGSSLITSMTGALGMLDYATNVPLLGEMSFSASDIHSTSILVKAVFFHLRYESRFYFIFKTIVRYFYLFFIECSN